MSHETWQLVNSFKCLLPYTIFYFKDFLQFISWKKFVYQNKFYVEINFTMIWLPCNIDYYSLGIKELNKLHGRRHGMYLNSIINGKQGSDCRLLLSFYYGFSEFLLIYLLNWALNNFSDYSWKILCDISYNEIIKKKLFHSFTVCLLYFSN